MASGDVVISGVTVTSAAVVASRVSSAYATGAV